MSFTETGHLTAASGDLAVEILKRFKSEGRSDCYTFFWLDGNRLCVDGTINLSDEERDYIASL